MHSKLKQNQHASTLVLGFFVKNPGNNSNMGFQDLLYFRKTKQEPLQPYPKSSWFTITLRFVQSSLAVIETKFPLLLPNVQFSLVSMTRSDWGRICKQGKLPNTTFCGLVVYSTGFVPLLVASVRTLGLEPKTNRCYTDSLFLTGMRCHSCEDAASGYDNFNLIVDLKACVE